MLRLAAFLIFCRFVFDFLKSLRASMWILEDMFVTLFNSYCSVCLSEGFFPALAASKNRKTENASFFQVKQQPK